MSAPSGLNATPFTSLVWPVKGGPMGLAGGGVPQPHRAVGAGAGHAAAVGAERHRVDGVVWPMSGCRRVGRWRCPTAAPSRRRRRWPAVCPSGLNATPLTQPVWPVSGWPTGWPVSASHSRTVPSALALASSVPSGLNATPLTKPVWPVSGWPSGCAGVAASHSRTVCRSRRRPAAGRRG